MMNETIHKAEDIARPRPRMAILCRFGIIASCVFFVILVLSGNHPPAVAQNIPYYGPATLQGLQMSSVYQEGKIDATLKDQATLQADFDAYKKSQDDRISRMWVDVKANTDAVSTLKGEILGASAFLSLLQIGSVVWGRKKVT